MPNLASFAEDVLRHGWVEKSDCFIFGSRGGQVVLPILWQQKGDLMPPAVVLNGGCAMKLPKPILWPDAAVTFLLMGGQDFFSGSASKEEYIEEARRHVPHGNSTTAILFVNEMQHMPQAKLLGAVLPLMLRALLSWKSTRSSPLEELRKILAVVKKDGWSGRLMFTKGPGQWAPDVEFGPYHVAQHQAASTILAPSPDATQPDAAPIQMTKKDELMALFRAAACAAKPGGGAPLASAGARLHALTKAVAASNSQGGASNKLGPAAPPGHTLQNVPAGKAVGQAPNAIQCPTSPSTPCKPHLSIPVAGCQRIPSATTSTPVGGTAVGRGTVASPCPPSPHTLSGPRLPIPLAGQSAAWAQVASPCGASPCTPNRLAVPRSPCNAPTPISRALGMGVQCLSPTSCVSSPSRLRFYGDLSPASRPRVVVR